VLIAFRFLPGFGVGGDYPVSALLMSEYANRKDRGKLVGMVLGTQALGLIVGPLVALALLGLRVSEATGADIEHLGLERGHRTLTITRKGGKAVGLEEPAGGRSAA
jgi:MFS family permease